MAKIAPTISRTFPDLLTLEGESFTLTPTALGSPDSWEADNLPDGAVIDSNTGVVTWADPTPGLHRFILRAIVDDSRAFTVDAGTDTCTSAGHPFANGDLVKPTSDNALPAPLVSGDQYEMRVADGEPDDFQMAARVGGAVVDFSDTGTGNHTLTRELVDELEIILPVAAKDSVVDLDTPDIEIQMDWLTKKLTIPGAQNVTWETPESEPIEDGLDAPLLQVHTGERFPVVFSCLDEGLRKDLNLVSLEIAGKEFDGEAAAVITDGTFTPLGSGRTRHWRCIFDFTTDDWASLVSNYEADKGTHFKAIAQFKLGILKDAEAYSANETKATAANMSPSSSETLSFALEDLPQFATATAFELQLDLIVTGRSAQNVTITRTFDLSWNGSAYVVANLAGDTTGDGEDEGDAHWQSTLGISSDPTGDADSVDFDVDVDASAFTAVNKITVPASQFDYMTVASGGGSLVSEPGASGWDMEIRNSDQSKVAQFHVGNGDTMAAIKTAAQTALDGVTMGATISEVVGDASTNEIFFKFSTVGSVDHLEGFDQATSVGIYDLVTDTGASRPASVKATIRTEGSAVSYAKTSQKFLLQVGSGTNE